MYSLNIQHYHYIGLIYYTATDLITQLQIFKQQYHSSLNIHYDYQFSFTYVTKYFFKSNCNSALNKMQYFLQSLQIECL